MGSLVFRVARRVYTVSNEGIMAHLRIPTTAIVFCLVLAMFKTDVLGQGYPPSFVPSIDRACYQVGLAGDLQRLERPLLSHKRELQYIDVFRSDRFLDSLEISQQFRDELRSGIVSYDATLQEVTSALMLRKAKELADAELKFETVVENLEQAVADGLNEKQKSIAHNVLWSRAVAAEGVLQVLQAGSTFELFGISATIEPVDQRVLLDYAESILKQWPTDSRVAFAEMLDILLMDVDHGFRKHVQDLICKQHSTLPISIYLISEPMQISTTSSLSEDDFMWVEGVMSFRMDGLGQLTRFSNSGIDGRRLPLAALVADKSVRQELSVELSDRQLSEINPYYSQFHLEYEGLWRQQAGLTRNDPERAGLERKMTELGTRFNEQVKSVLLDSQWKEFESLSAMRLVYKHGLPTVIGHLAERYAEEHGLSIGAPISESQHKHAMRLLADRVVQIENRYREELKRVVGEFLDVSHSESLSLLEETGTHRVDFLPTLILSCHDLTAENR